MENKNVNKNSLGYKFGRFVGAALVGFVGVALVGTVGALTIKLLSLIFTWLFF